MPLQVDMYSSSRARGLEQSAPSRELAMRGIVLCAKQRSPPTFAVLGLGGAGQGRGNTWRRRAVTAAPARPSNQAAAGPRRRNRMEGPRQRARGFPRRASRCKVDAVTSVDAGPRRRRAGRARRAPTRWTVDQ